MKVVVLLLALWACGPGLRDAEPQYRNPKLGDFAARLAEASQRANVPAIRRLLGDRVVNGGLWFSDVECLKQFAFPGEVRGERLDAFARCLATLMLAQGARTDALPDVAILTYGPGLELEARFVEDEDGPRLAWIGYVARRNVQDALPTISASALEALRVEGEPHGPVSDPSAFAAELAIGPFAYAWLKICIDANGTVTGTHLREATSPQAARAFAAAARTWQFRPFVLGSQPTPVCAMARMMYPPPEKAPTKEQLPLPLPSEDSAITNVPSIMLGPRVAGDINVTPDDQTRTWLRKARVPRLIGAFHYCISESGRVDRVVVIRPTGVPSYDRKLVKAISSWAYRPFLDEGRPIRVCSSVRFIYTQGDAGPAGMMSQGRMKR